MDRRKILIPVIAFTGLIIILIIVLNPKQKYNKLSVNISKWNSILESRIESENLILENIKFNDYKLIIDEKNNTLYYSLLKESRNKYNPKVEYSSNSSNTKLIILSDDITDEKIKNNHYFKIMIYNEKEYHIYYLKCTDLPILNISYNEAEESKPKHIPIEIYLFDNISKIPNRITISRGDLKKKEDDFIFSLYMLTPGKNQRDNQLSILNMKPNSDYILTTQNNESQNEINNKIELFLNNEYKGVYFLKYIDKKITK